MFENIPPKEVSTSSIRVLFNSTNQSPVPIPI
jgi:hypothetical protein